MEPVGALGDIFRARASRWRNLAAGGIMPSWRPAVGLIAKLLEEIALKPPYVFCGGRGWWRAHVLACGLSGHGDLLRSPAASRPLCAASANSLKTFPKKCLTEIVVLLI